MKAFNFLGSLLLAATIVACSNKESETKQVEPPKPVVVEVDTTNIMVARIKMDDKWGFIGYDFKSIVSSQYDDALNFSEGLACVKKGDKWGFINIKNELVIPFVFDVGGEFHEGLAKIGNFVSSVIGVPKYFFIDTKGNNVFGKTYSRAEDFNNGITFVKEGQGFFIDNKGNKVDSAYVISRTELYNHFKASKKPFGGAVSKSVQLDPKTGKPNGVKYLRDKMGYADENGGVLTGTVYDVAGEFTYSYKVPAKFYSTKKEEPTSKDSSLTQAAAENQKIEERVD